MERQDDHGHRSKPMSVLSAPYFHNEAAAYAELQATLWPYGPVPALRWIGSDHDGQGWSDRPVSVWPLQAPVHRHRWHRIRVEPCAVEPMTASRLSDVQQQEGDQQSPTDANLRCSIQD